MLIILDNTLKKLSLAKDFVCIMRIHLLFVLLVAVLAVVSACSTSSVEPANNIVGYGYFPLQKGRYAIYDVDSTSWRFVGGNSVAKYQLKELVSDSFPDIFGGITFKIERYRRPDTNANWRLDSVWTATRTATQAVKTENNVSFIKILFPVKNGSEWDGNRLSSEHENSPEIYTMSGVGKPLSLGAINFSNTLKVTHANDSSCLGKNQSIEYYAEGIGLIFKQKIKLKYKENDFCLTDSIEYGGIYNQTLIKYGKE